jgi:RNA polymerase sigma factor (TIGR02999 family)
VASVNGPRNGCRGLDVLDASITTLLQRVREGDAIAKDELIPAIYAELHTIAHRYLRRNRPDHTLQPTALVNEVYLKIFRTTTPQFSDRAHFLAYASQAMRTILVDYARTRASAKRDGGQRISSDVIEIPLEKSLNLVQLLDLDSALETLARENPGPAQAIEMRYFGGMTAEETAEAAKRSVHIIQHELRFAHAWLRRRLAGLHPDPPAPG